MSAILGTSVTGAGAAGSYAVNNSVRIRSSASAFLSRAFGSSGTLTTWTWSAWVKRGNIGAQTRFMSCNGTASDRLVLLSDNTIEMTIAGARLTTTQVFRDPSAWYHFVVVWDTTQGTSSNRFKFYVNGSQVTAFSTASYPAQNATSSFGAANTWVIGAGSTGALEPFDGYFAEMHYVNGQALTPSSFGETNASTGVWQPKAYAGSYGTNGFYQKYSSIATTSGSNSGLGQDFSGNGNFFNTNNISVTAGATYDAMTDSPTPVSSTVGNYAVWNPLVNTSSRNTFSNGNLQVDATTQPNYQSVSTFGMSSGKWYCELSWNTGDPGRSVVFGITNNPMSSLNYWTAESDANSWTYYSFNGNKSNNGSSSGYGSSYTMGDIIGIAFDADTGALTFYKNNVSQGTAYTGLTSGPYFVMAANSSGNADGWFANFGQRPFTYTPPTGFNRMQTFNLPTPTVGASATTLAGKYFNPVLYTGTGSARSVTGVGFQPDFVWIKERSSTSQHALFDAVRGVQKRIVSDTSAAEDTSAQLLTAFNSDGFSVGTDGAINENSQTYVGWNWNAGGSNATNTAGDITSTVRANTTAGFSIVQYNGPASGSGNKTIGHGLGVAPAMIFVKSLNFTYNWDVYHQSLGFNASLILNSTNSTRSGAFGANPTSTVFTATKTYTWDTNINYVAYCFAEKVGFSKFGSYTGNSSTDGTFVYTGFRPAYVMIKRSSASGQWSVRDDMRLGYNASNSALEANQSTAETTSTAYTTDLLSNGFKLRTADDAVNASGSTYIYMAFAENPFNYSLAR